MSLYNPEYKPELYIQTDLIFCDKCVSVWRWSDHRTTPMPAYKEIRSEHNGHVITEAHWDESPGRCPHCSIGALQRSYEAIRLVEPGEPLPVNPELGHSSIDWFYGNCGFPTLWEELPEVADCCTPENEHVVCIHCERKSKRGDYKIQYNDKAIGQSLVLCPYPDCDGDVFMDRKGCHL